MKTSDYHLNAPFLKKPLERSYVMSFCYLPPSACSLGTGGPTGGRWRQTMEKRSRMVRQSGKANSQGWVKLGQEAHSICPKMASPFLYHPQAMAQYWKDYRWSSSHSKKRKGIELLRQLGCIRSATPSPLTHVLLRNLCGAERMQEGPLQSHWMQLSVVSYIFHNGRSLEMSVSGIFHVLLAILSTSAIIPKQKLSFSFYQQGNQY